MKRRKVIKIEFIEYVVRFVISFEGRSAMLPCKDTDVVFFAVGRKLDTFEVKHTNIIAKVRLR
jgi:hypothetical protein